MATDRSRVELFILLLLRGLLVGPAKTHVVLKGGCNLRFFFGSRRYSEDIDFDVSVIATGTLRKNVDKLLDPLGPMARHLGTHGLTIGAVSAPKQTETTQRWKIHLQHGATVLHTKVEFSRRGSTEEGTLEAVDARVTQEHQLPPTLARHYSLASAARQKVGALAGRPTTQARDVFDLALLISRGGGLPDLGDEAAVAAKAAECAASVSYDQFSAQVVGYLDPEDAPAYASAEAWDALQLHVIEALEKSAS